MHGLGVELERTAPRSAASGGKPRAAGRRSHAPAGTAGTRSPSPATSSSHVSPSPARTTAREGTHSDAGAVRTAALRPRGAMPTSPSRDLPEGPSTARRQRRQVGRRADLQRIAERARRDPEAVALEEEAVGRLVGRQQVEGRHRATSPATDEAHDRVPTNSWVMPARKLTAFRVGEAGLPQHREHLRRWRQIRHRLRQVGVRGLVRQRAADHRHDPVEVDAVARRAAGGCRARSRRAARCARRGARRARAHGRTPRARPRCAARTRT